MKKLIPILLFICLLGSLAACGQQTEQVAIITPAPLAEQTETETVKEVAIPDLEEITAAQPEDVIEPAEPGESQVSRSEEAEESTDTPEETTETAETSETGEAAEEDVNLAELAQSYEGRTLDEMLAAVGSPESEEYTVSCMEDGAFEGMLYYGDFMVWTLQYTDGTEIILGVQAY